MTMTFYRNYRTVLAAQFLSISKNVLQIYLRREDNEISDIPLTILISFILSLTLVDKIKNNIQLTYFFNVQNTIF